MALYGYSSDVTCYLNSVKSRNDCLRALKLGLAAITSRPRVGACLISFYLSPNKYDIWMRIYSPLAQIYYSNICLNRLWLFICLYFENIMFRYVFSSIVWVLLARWFFTQIVEFSWLTRKSFTNSSRQLVGGSYQWIWYDIIYIYIILYLITEGYIFINLCPTIQWEIWHLSLEERSEFRLALLNDISS